MSTVAESIVAAMQAVLQPALFGVRVERSRMAALTRDDLPAVIVKPINDQASPLANALQRGDLTVQLDIHTRGDIPDQLADPIAASTHQALLNDPTLGGLCARIRYLSREWEFIDADRPACRLSMLYLVTYLTSANDLNRLA